MSQMSQKPVLQTLRPKDFQTFRPSDLQTFRPSDFINFTNSKKMFIPTQNIRSMKRVSPPKRGAAEPVNLKIHRNPAKTALRPFGLVRRRAHFFARISCVFKECVSNGLGRWFWSFCRNKRTIKSQSLSLTKVLPKAIESLSAVTDKSLNPESLKHLCPCVSKPSLPIRAHPPRRIKPPRQPLVPCGG